ncbi:hypothetical protein [Kineosporia sp. NBRC 101731]|uniref:hypothetical protein n=1 Tax=Kineosporia sp. NBRC 101731 TaxID=3032199 RepID=UPI0024A5E837|nr:hypothetical protein [Kineosporia sp. NBRC 101731]GLY28166.1 hypothetical protein Kisp02_15310 [Kineosporia sp. NBRC 101731]
MSLIALFLLLALGILALVVMGLFFFVFWLIYTQAMKARREHRQSPSPDQRLTEQ